MTVHYDFAVAAMLPSSKINRLMAAPPEGRGSANENILAGESPLLNLRDRLLSTHP